MKSRTKQINSFSVQGLNNTQSNGSAYPSISSAYWQPAPNPTPYLVPGKDLYIKSVILFYFKFFVTSDDINIVLNRRPLILITYERDYVTGKKSLKVARRVILCV